jgi:hypothetical protein
VIDNSGSWKALAVLTLLAFGWLLLARPEAAADQASEVLVTNLPAVQTIEGEVTVRTPVPSTRFVRTAALVSPAALAEINNLTELGILDADGFASATLGISGVVQGTAARGAVGIVLIPDQPEILAAFQEHGRFQLAIRLDAEADPRTGLFSSEVLTARLVAPRYRVFAYNETAHAARLTTFTTLATS